MHWAKRAAMVLLAAFFLAGPVACGPKAKAGEGCKRHSECETGICGSDLKCHTKDSERKMRTSKKKRGD